jgi:hypothetical protein
MHRPTLVAATTSPNIRLETGIMTTADSHSLPAAAVILVSLHRSERMGPVPAEAMVLGASRQLDVSPPVEAIAASVQTSSPLST